MYHILTKIVGLGGMLLVLYAYYLLWLSPDAEFGEVIFRTRAAIVLNLSGGLMVLFYLYKK